MASSDKRGLMSSGVKWGFPPDLRVPEEVRDESSQAASQKKQLYFFGGMFIHAAAISLYLYFIALGGNTFSNWEGGLVDYLRMAAALSFLFFVRPRDPFKHAWENGGTGAKVLRVALTSLMATAILVSVAWMFWGTPFGLR